MLKRLPVGSVATLLMMVVLTVPAMAQEKLAEGIWSGSVFPPDDEAMDLDYDVSYVDGELDLVLMLPAEMGMDEVQAGEVDHDGDLLSFTLDVGMVVFCELYQQDDGHFEGECADASGDSGLLTMYPPEQIR